MANSVNDVMNVIASPDYGIKNIAGTNQEILAILSGNHNSKNNIHAIVDDIRNIIQKFVEAQTKKDKPINVIGDTLTKINKKNFQNILDEAKSIRKAIDNLAKKIEKQGGKNMPAIAKLTDKASQKVADAMIKNIDEEKKGGGMSAVVDAFNKLKDISLKDIIFGKLKLKHIKDVLKESKDALNIDKKEFDNITKVINAAPEIVKSLSKIGWRIKFIIKSGTIQKLNEILVGKNSILTIANVLKENKKSFEEGQKNAKQVTILVGNLLVSSIYLTIAFFTAGPAILGAKLLDKMLNSIIPVAEKLSNSNEQISKASNAAITFIVCTGLLAISSVFLATIAVTGIHALLGSILLVGIVELNVEVFRILDKSNKIITKGAGVMFILSASLILYGIALKLITDSTKDISWKHVGIIAATIGILTAAVVALGFASAFIAPGAGALALMGIALIAYGYSLNLIVKATKTLTLEEIKFVASSMWILGKSIAKMALLTIPISLGSIALGIMSTTLYVFVKSLKMISDMGTVPTKQVHQVLNVMKVVGDFFAKNGLGLKAIWRAYKYKSIMRPFAGAIKHLTKLKNLGVVPMKLVYGALNAMGVIANYYAENPIETYTIMQARRYKRMLRPFGKTIKFLGRLKEMGVIPMKLVYGVLNAMSVIGNYYKENEIERKTIKQARRYKRMLKPFGTAVGYLSELKNLGNVPLNAVKDTTKAMSYISFFYKTVFISDDIEEKSEFIKLAVEKFNNTAKDINDKFNNIKEIDYKSIKSIISSLYLINLYYSFTKPSFTIKKVIKMNTTVKLFTENIEYLKKTQDYTKSNDDNVKILLRSMRRIIRFLRYYSLDRWERRRARKNIILLSAMSAAMSGISNINPSNISSIGDAITNALSGVNTIDISQVKAVTNMFDAFNKINKSENIINKFTESVKEFTTTCKDLMDAMSQNTDAINNIDTNGMGNSFTNIINGNNGNNYLEGNSNDTTQTNGIRISNVDEIAKTIAEKINGALSLDVPDTQVQLLINGMGGNEWTITRY